MKRSKKQPDSNTADVTGDGEHSLGSRFDPSAGLNKLASLSANDLLEVIKTANDVQSRLWFRRAVALGALSEQRELDRLNKRQRGAFIRETSESTGVKAVTLREDLRIYRELLKGRTEQLQTLACERLERDFYVVASGAPDPVAALQEARSCAFTRATFRAHVAVLKGVKPRKKPRYPAEVEAELAKVRSSFPSDTDEAILVRLLRHAQDGTRKAARSPAPAALSEARLAAEGRTLNAAPSAADDRPAPQCRDPGPAV